MRIAFVLLAVLGLTIGVGGQSGVQAPQAQATWKTDAMSIAIGSGDKVTLPGGRAGMAARLVAQGVEIRIGNSILVADEAEVSNWAGSTGPAEVQLRGNVRLRTVLDVRQD